MKEIKVFFFSFLLMAVGVIGVVLLSPGIVRYFKKGSGVTDLLVFMLSLAALLAWLVFIFYAIFQVFSELPPPPEGWIG